MARSRARRTRSGHPPLGRTPHIGARDLADSAHCAESLQRSRIRREVAAQRQPLVNPKTATVATVFAMTALPTATAAAHALVRRGSRGAPVRTLQRELGVTADGIFGHITAHALKRFQRDHSLVVDGIAGPATWAALEASGHAASVGGHGGGHERAHGRLLTGTVRGVQRALGIAVDGIFGPQTEHAVRAFQRDHGLVVDGIVGPVTWAALTGDASANGGSHHRHHAHAAVAGGVRGLQEALGVTVDGVFGPQTEHAVRAFQRDHGLVVDGVVGPVTRAALGMPPGPTLHERGQDGGGASSGSGAHASGVVARVIAAANRIATLPYRYGGGHGSFHDSAYDCSGSVSYALHGGGLLDTPEDSTQLESYGAPGPGKHITIYANAGHAFMVIDGRRFDTGAQAETGSRWSSAPRSTAGFVVRHPVGY